MCINAKLYLTLKNSDLKVGVFILRDLDCFLHKKIRKLLMSFCLWNIQVCYGIESSKQVIATLLKTTIVKNVCLYILRQLGQQILIITSHVLICQCYRV